MHVTLDMQGSPLSEACEYLQVVSGIRISLAKAPRGLGERQIDLKAADISMSAMLRLLTLPRGLDARIESGTVVIFVP